jgi:hypothetical protein
VPTDSRELLAQALALPESERLWLADELIISVKPPGVMSVDDPGFEAEILRRSDELHSGTAETIPGEVVLEMLDKIIGSHGSRGCGPERGEGEPS